MSYYGNIVNPPSTVNPASMVPINASTQLANYGNTYMVTTSGLTITLMALNPSVQSASLVIVNDSTGTTTVNANGTDLIQIAGVGSASLYLFAGETITLVNNGTYWALTTVHFNGMRQMQSSMLPSTTDLGPIFVTDMQSIMTFVNTAYYTGYRSINVGDVHFGTTNTARPGFIDCMGGTFNMSSYPGLWAYAQEQSLTIASGSWTSGPGLYSQITSTTFRVPDLQNQFLRFTGTDADTSSARLLSAFKRDQIQNVTGTVAPYVDGSSAVGSTSVTGAFKLPASVSGSTVTASTRSYTSNWGISFDASGSTRAGNETTSISTSYKPWLKV